jgi:hypothetical protein
LYGRAGLNRYGNLTSTGIRSSDRSHRSDAL